MEYGDLPIYELKLEDVDFDGMEAISIVEFPAIERDFMKFSSQFNFARVITKRIEPDACEHCVRLYGSRSNPKEFTYKELSANKTNKGLKPEQWKPVLGKTHPNCKCKNVFKNKLSSDEITLSKFDDEKRIITGPALVPEQLIYRNDKKRGEFLIKFSAYTIEKLNINFFKNFKQQNINIEHDIDVKDVTVMESWIVKNSDNDKSKELGFENIENGTWMVSMKIDNDEVWEKIKNGDLKGFSIEAMLSNSIIKNSFQDEDENEQMIIEIESLINDTEIVNYSDIIEGLDNIINEL
jgi:hypothetical protein